MHRISKVSKTRWIASHINLLSKVSQSWLCFVYSLLHLDQNAPEIKIEHKQKIIELLKTLRGKNFLINVHFHLDVTAILTEFSLTTQYDTAIIVSLKKVLNLVIKNLTFLRSPPQNRIQVLDNDAGHE